MPDLFQVADLIRSQEAPDTLPRTFTSQAYESNVGLDVLNGDQRVARYRGPDSDTTIYVLLVNRIRWDLRLVAEDSDSGQVVLLADSDQKARTLALLKAHHQYEALGLITEELSDPGKLIRLLEWSADTDAARRDARRNKLFDMRRQVELDLALFQRQTSPAT